MKSILFIILFLPVFDAMAQDTVYTQLVQLKGQYSQKLITRKKYNLERMKLLGLCDTPVTNFKNPDKADSPPKLKEKVSYNFQVVPVAYFDFRPPNILQGDNLSGNEQSGGLHLEIGPSLGRQFHPDFVFGVEGTPGTILVPVYADMNAALTKNKLAPFFHAGFGYIVQIVSPYGKNDVSPGILLQGGLGIKAQITEQLAIAASADYRFYSGPQVEDGTYHHQFGLRCAFIYYKIRKPKGNK